MFTNNSEKEVWKNYSGPQPSTSFLAKPIKQDPSEFSDCTSADNQTANQQGFFGQHQPFLSQQIPSEGCSNYLAQPNLYGFPQGGPPTRLFLQESSDKSFKQKNRFSGESPDKRTARLEAQRQQQQIRIASESTEERTARLFALRERQKLRIANESSEHRLNRLTALREKQKLRLASESTDQRARRLEALRIRQRERIANETPEQRARRLADLRERQRIRLANETPEKRAARLAALRLRQQVRAAGETPEQRVCRLEEAKERQNARLAAETKEERNARFAYYRRRKRACCNCTLSEYKPRKHILKTPSLNSLCTTPPVPSSSSREDKDNKPANADGTSAEYWWETHFLIPALTSQPSPCPTPQPAHVNPAVHLAWDSYVQSGGSAIFSPLRNINLRAIAPQTIFKEEPTTVPKDNKNRT